MQRDFRCDTNRLRLLLQDELPPPAQAELVGHLDDCEECQQALEALASDKGWWRELRQIDGLGKRKAQVLSPSATETPDRERMSVDKQGHFPIDFLDSSAEPDVLGLFDRFAVTAVLGRGGFGVVLKAHDANLNRTVGIKVLAPYFASSGAARKRFAREAQAAATVVHPHVVPIYSVDSWKGLPYLVMACVPGRPLQERLDREGPLEVKEILRIGMQTASGLAAAHNQGLVHRDVKPANILLEHDVGRVWLTDFGLARAADDASLTQSGVIAGTPQYMAPEQAQGLTVDHRADLFSLGSTLYAMCTGHAPFRADSAIAVLRRVCDDCPRPIREVNPDIPVWLVAIIDKLLAKAPGDRYQSATEVTDLLEKCLAHMQQPDVNPLPLELTAVSKDGNGGFRRPFLSAAVTLLFGLGAAVLLWNPWGNGASRDKGEQPPTAVSGAANNGTTSGRPQGVKKGEGSAGEDPLEHPLEKMHVYTAAFMSELKQATPGSFDASIDNSLRQTRQRLDALEREVSAPPPRKSMGFPSVEGEIP